MNKSELIDVVADATSESKATIGRILDAAIDGVIGAVAEGDKVSFAGFGTFERRHRKARVGRNPQTGEEVNIAAANVPAFKAGKAFKDAVR